MPTKKAIELTEDSHLFRAQLNDLTLRSKNERRHSERNVRDIARSLDEFGQQAAVLITKGGVVVKGNGTTMAARLLDWTHITVRVTDLKGQEIDEYAIADNQTGQTSEWDVRNLSGQLKEFRLADPEFDFGRIGFEDFEADPLLLADWEPDAVDDGDHTTFAPQRSIRLNQEQHEVVMLAIELAARQGAVGEHGDVLVVVCQQYIDSTTATKENENE